MPVIKRFRNCVIRMYADDHRPPHFHILGPDSSVAVDIKSLKIIAGFARTDEIRKAMEWAEANVKILAHEWTRLNQRG